MDANRILRSIKADRSYNDQITHIEPMAAQSPTFEDLRQPLPESLQAVLAAGKVERLYSHQAEAVESVRSGDNIVVVTGTASGKSLCYQLPIYERLLQEPFSSALLLYPTKALAQDQLRTFIKFNDAVNKIIIGSKCRQVSRIKTCSGSN